MWNWHACLITPSLVEREITDYHENENYCFSATATKSEGSFSLLRNELNEIVLHRPLLIVCPKEDKLSMLCLSTGFCSTYLFYISADLNRPKQKETAWLQNVWWRLRSGLPGVPFSIF